MDFFRNKRPIVIFFILFTLLGGVVVGIICANKEICDFGKAYVFSLCIGAGLAAWVLGFARFGFLFKIVGEFGLPEDFDRNIRSFDFLFPFRLIGWAALLLFTPIIGLVLLPVDIIMTIILLIVDLVVGVHTGTSPSSNRRKKTKNGVSDETSETEPRYYISKITDLTDNDVKTLCQIVEKYAKPHWKKLKTKGYRYLGNISHRLFKGGLHMYFVYQIDYIENGITKNVFYVAFFKNLYRKKDGTLGFKGDRPYPEFYAHIMLMVNYDSLIGMFPSIYSLCSVLSEDGELDSNFMDLSQFRNQRVQTP